jgi:bla regulator protein blaR1
MMTANLDSILAHLWQSTLCVFLAWLLTSTLKNNRASVRYWIWLAASVKFLVPFSLLVSAGSDLGSWILPVHEQTQVFSVVAEISRPFLSSAQAPVAAKTLPAFHPVLAVLLGVWFPGFIITAIYWLLWWRRIHLVLRTATPLHLNLPIRLSIRIVSSPARLEPGVFGIRKPVLLLPEGITRSLSQDQLETVIAHELCHVQRRDNLTAAMHMLVETIFWFYPPVWWIRTRLIEEREWACDEAVLQDGSAANTYAESILNVCRLYVESPLACASGITGSNLNRRIARILAEHTAQQLGWPKKLLLATAGAVALSFPIVFGLLHATRTWAQAVGVSPKVLPKFEVATVKPSLPGGTMVMTKFTPDGIQIRNSPLTMIIQLATGQLAATDDAIIGAPSWVKTEKYDIDAKVSESDIPKMDKLSHTERNEMMRSVLVDHFNFAAHQEISELPVYELVAVKGGPKLRKATPGDTYPNGLKDDQGKSSPDTMRVVAGRVDAQAISMTSLLGILTPLAGRPVVDKTGLTGKYDITLRWKPEGPHPNSTAEGGSTEDSDVDFFTAIQEQLGLKLIPAKGPVSVLVVDHIEKPSDN